MQENEEAFDNNAIHDFQTYNHNGYRYVISGDFIFETRFLNMLSNIATTTHDAIDNNGNLVRTLSLDTNVANYINNTHPNGNVFSALPSPIPSETSEDLEARYRSIRTAPVIFDESPVNIVVPSNLSPSYSMASASSSMLAMERNEENKVKGVEFSGFRISSYERISILYRNSIMNPGLLSPMRSELPSEPTYAQLDKDEAMESFLQDLETNGSMTYRVQVDQYNSDVTTHESMYLEYLFHEGVSDNYQMQNTANYKYIIDTYYSNINREPLVSGPVETRDPNSLESLRLQPDEIYDNNAPGITYHELTQEKYINRFESIRGTVADNEIHTNIVESSCNTTLIDESNNLD